MDNGEEFSPSNVKNDSSWHVGMRHYSGRHWATDVSYRRSEHDIKTAGTDTSKSYRFQTWAVQLQYNIDALDSLRLYAGGGLGYSKMKGPAGKDDSFHPVTSLGATYAVTKNVFVNAEMFTSFARYKGTVEARRRRLRAQAHGDRLHALPGRGVLTPHESVPDATPVNGAFRLFR